MRRIFLLFTFYFLICAAAPAQNQVRVTITADETNRSGTITTGGTAQTVAAAKDNRVHFVFQNISDTDMYLRWTGTASAGAGSLLIPKNGGSYENPANFCPSSAISVFCATTGKAFTAYEK